MFGLPANPLSCFGGAGISHRNRADVSLTQFPVWMSGPFTRFRLWPRSDRLRASHCKELDVCLWSNKNKNLITNSPSCFWELHFLQYSHVCISNDGILVAFYRLCGPSRENLFHESCVRSPPRIFSVTFVTSRCS